MKKILTMFSLMSFLFLFLLFLFIPTVYSAGYGESEVYFEAADYGITGFIFQAPEVYVNTSFWAKATVISNDTYSANTFNITVGRPSTLSIIVNDASQPNPALAGSGSQWIANWTFNATAAEGTYTINVSLPFFNFSDSENVTLIEKPNNWNGGYIEIEVESTYNFSETGIIYAVVKDKNNNYVNIIGNCTTTIYWPNATEWKSDKVMTYLNGTNGQYYYNFVAHSSVRGTYNIDVDCIIPIGSDAGTFEIEEEEGGEEEETTGGGSWSPPEEEEETEDEEIEHEEVTYGWESIPGGGIGVVIINKPEIDIANIVLYAKEELTAPKITIKQFSAKPPELPVVDKNVYKYIEIKATNIEESKLLKAKITFKIIREWFTANKIDENTVTLNLFEDNKWIKLATKKIGSNNNFNDNGVNAFQEGCDFICYLSGWFRYVTDFSATEYIYYEAFTPGFSYFTITGESLLAASKLINITEYPTSITIEQGAVEYKHIKIKNIGDEKLTNVYLTLQGIDDNWYTIDPANAYLNPGEEEIFIIKFMIPEDAKKKTYSMIIYAVSDQAELITLSQLEIIGPVQEYVYDIFTWFWIAIILTLVVVLSIMIVTLYRVRKSLDRIAIQKRILIHREINETKNKILKPERNRKLRNRQEIYFTKKRKSSLKNTNIK